MNLFNKKHDCCGCSACMHVCPVNAISMKPDEEGFLYPQINADLCTKCELCRDICTSKDNYNVSEYLEKPEIYAMVHKDKEVLLSSSSGGMFTAISDYILSNNGIVYGAAFDEYWKVKHKRAYTSNGRDFFKGSKYTQSEISVVFNEVKTDLDDGKQVLFTGTPCQIAALKKFTGKSDNLYLCDLLCHGVSSPLIWSDYIKYIESEYKSKLIDFNSRSKVLGWSGGISEARFEDGRFECSSIPLLSYWYLASVKSLTFRPSCYQCKYTNLKRVSDITLGDFWRINKSIPDFYNKKGVSLVIVNTSKGQELFNKSHTDFNSKQACESDLVNPALKQHAFYPSARVEFWNNYKANGYQYVSEYYGIHSLISKINNRKIVVFGAKREFICAHEIRRELLFIIDNDLEIQNSGLNLGDQHINVFSLNHALKIIPDDAVIIINPGIIHKAKVEIYNQLLSMGIDKDKII